MMVWMHLSKKKGELCKAMERGGSKGKFLTNKCRRMETVYKAKKEAHESLTSKLNNVTSRHKIFRLARFISINNRAIIDEQYIRNDHGKVMVDNFGIRNSWREHHSCLFNEEFDWDKHPGPSSSSPEASFSDKSCKVKETLYKTRHLYAPMLHKIVKKQLEQ